MDDPTPDRVYFNTDEFAEHERFSVFCEEVVRCYASLDIVRRGEGSFRGVIEMQRAGAVDVSSNFSTPADYLRSPKLVGDGSDSILVALCHSGRAHHSQRGHELKLEPGDAVVCDLGYTGSFHLTADTHFSTVKVPRATISKLFPSADRLTGLRLVQDDVARRLLFGYLGGTLDVTLNTGPAAKLYGDHIVDLIALALGAQGGARELAEQRGARAVRLAAVLRDIETLMADPNLSAAAVARRLGVTPRYVHMLLEETGSSFSQHVLEKRLDHAAGLLRHPGQRDRRIAEIALESGFADLSHFNRTFRRRFGDTPRGFRSVSRPPDDK